MIRLVLLQKVFLTSHHLKTHLKPFLFPLARIARIRAVFLSRCSTLGLHFSYWISTQMRENSVIAHHRQQQSAITCSFLIFVFEQKQQSGITNENYPGKIVLKGILRSHQFILKMMLHSRRRKKARKNLLRLSLSRMEIIS